MAGNHHVHSYVVSPGVPQCIRCHCSLIVVIFINVLFECQNVRIKLAMTQLRTGCFAQVLPVQTLSGRCCMSSCRMCLSDTDSQVNYYSLLPYLYSSMITYSSKDLPIYPVITGIFKIRIDLLEHAGHWQAGEIDDIGSQGHHPPY